MSSAPVCPGCGGLWLYNYVFSHVAACAVLAADDATQAADWWRRDGCRPATVAEVQLAGLFAPLIPADWPDTHSTAPDAIQFTYADGVRTVDFTNAVTVVAWFDTVHYRIIGGISPDQLLEEQEVQS